MDRYVSTKTEGVKGITLQLGGNMDISIKCDSLKAIYIVKNGMLRCVTPYEFTISQMPMIKVCIEEVGNRIITFTCEEEIEAKSYIRYCKN